MSKPHCTIARKDRNGLPCKGRDDTPLTPAGQTAEEPDAGQGGFLYGLLRYVRSVYAVNGTDGKILTSPEGCG